MKQPIFILGSHKSGTSLLRNLLDGASELFVVPCEAHFFQYGGYWVDYALRSSIPSRLTFEELVESFTELAKASNERTSQTSPVDLVGRWDIERFNSYLRMKGQVTYRESGFRGFLDTYIEAIHVSLCGDVPSADRFAEKSVENAEFASLLVNLYPDAAFLHIIRNPYATIVSLRKHMGHGRYPFLGGAINALNNSYYYLYKNLKLLPKYKVIRYEDLVKAPREVMEQVADFIQIEFVQALLEPTVMGMPWIGNSSSDRGFEGVSTEPVVRYQHEIRPLETALINLLFSHVLVDYGYHRRSDHPSPYLPCPREHPRTYLANRWLWQSKKRASRYLFRAPAAPDSSCLVEA